MRFLILLALVSCASSKELPQKVSASKAIHAPTATIHWHTGAELDLALQKAAAQKKTVVVDFWAKWCHSCLSMKHYVLKAKELGASAQDVIWVAVETDKPENEALMKRFPVAAWPTFYFLTSSGDVLLKKQGTTSVEGFRQLITTASKVSKIEDNEKRLQLAAALQAPSDHVASLEKMAMDNPWPGRNMAALALLDVRARKHHNCSSFFRSYREALGGMEKVDFAYSMASCEIGKEQKETSPSESLEIAIKDIADASNSPEFAPDDRSALLGALRYFYKQSPESWRKAIFVATDQDYAKQQKELLLQAFDNAKSPQQAMTFLWPLAEVHDFLGEHEALLPRIHANEKALPNEYDPPYRLAWLYLKLGRYNKASAAIERALTKGYGPRKGRILTLKAEIIEAGGDVDAKPHWQAVVDYYNSLPKHLRSPRSLKNAQLKVAEKP